MVCNLEFLCKIPILQFGFGSLESGGHAHLM